MESLKITTNNELLFQRLGNILIKPTELIDMLTYKDDMTTLLTEICSGDFIYMIIEYMSKHRLKTLSNTVQFLISTYGIEFNIAYSCYIPKKEVYTDLGNLIYCRYYNKWSKIYNTFKLEYDPIRPYDMSIKDIEKVQTDNSINIKRNGSHSDTSNENVTDTESNTMNENSSGSNEDTVVSDKTKNSLYGFNSTVPVNTDESDNTSSSNGTFSNSTENESSRELQSSNTKSSTGTITNNADTQQDKVVDSDREITRLGNIGNTTQQELIERERKLLQYQMFDVIFRDLDKVLTSATYL